MIMIVSSILRFTILVGMPGHTVRPEYEFSVDRGLDRAYPFQEGVRAGCAGLQGFLEHPAADHTGRGKFFFAPYHQPDMIVFVTRYLIPGTWYQVIQY